MSRLIRGSSALNGSSYSITFGSTANARATPTRCCMPPESWSGNWLAASSRPTRRSTSSARASRAAFGTPCTSSPNATLSITRRCASRPKCWKIIETLCRRSWRSSSRPAAITSCPAMSIAPAVGSISRIRVRTSVDLPEPERPITTKTSPGQTLIDTSRTAATQPVFSRSSLRDSSASGVPRTRWALLPKIFHTPSARMSGSPLRSTRSPFEPGATAPPLIAAALIRASGAAPGKRRGDNRPEAHSTPVRPG